MALTGIIQRRDLKLSFGGNPPIEGEIVWATDTDEFGWLASDGITVIWSNFERPNGVEWGTGITGNINLQTDLQLQMAGKASENKTDWPIDSVTNLRAELDNRYLKTDFIDESTGSLDGDKPVKTGTNGLIHSSLIASTTFTLIGNWTPNSGNEYPQVTGIIAGDYWIITNVDTNIGYTFIGGDLLGITMFNNDQLTWSTNGWISIAGNVNPDAYLRRDGTTPMIGDMDAGDNYIRNVKNGIDDQDVVTKLQSETYSDTTKSVIGHSHTNGALTTGEQAYEVYDVGIQGHLALTAAQNPHNTSFSSLDETPNLAAYAGKKGQRVSVNDNEDGLIFEPSSGSGMFSGEFLFDNSSYSIPSPTELTDGQLRQNNVNSALVTELYISQNDKNGYDRTYGLNVLRKGDLFGYTDNSTGAFALYRLRAHPSQPVGDNFLTFEVTEQTNSGIQFTDGASIVGEISFSSAKFFEELQDVPGHPIDNPSYVPFENASNKFLKVNAGDLTDGTGVEYKALEINDIGFVIEDATTPSTLQVELDSKLGGLGKTDAIIMEEAASLVTTDAENILNYGLSGSGDPLFPDKSFVNIGEAGNGVNINGVIFNPITMKNDTAIKAYDSTYAESKNLISRTSTYANNTNTGSPAAYNNEVTIGDSDVRTVIRDSSGFRPMVRSGVNDGATDTTDFLIHTDEDFTIAEYEATEALAVANKAELDLLTPRVTDNEGDITRIDTYVGIDDTSGLSLRIKTNEDNIITNDTDILALQTDKFDKVGGEITGDVKVTGATTPEIAINSQDSGTGVSKLSMQINGAERAYVSYVASNVSLNMINNGSTTTPLTKLILNNDGTASLTDGSDVASVPTVAEHLVVKKYVDDIKIADDLRTVYVDVSETDSDTIVLPGRYLVDNNLPGTGTASGFMDVIAYEADDTLKQNLVTDTYEKWSRVSSTAGVFSATWERDTQDEQIDLNKSDIVADKVILTDHVTDLNNPHALSVNSLTDATILTPVTNQTLQWDGTNWLNSFVILNELNDVTISGLADKQILVYDSTTTQWVNKDNSLADATNDGLMSSSDKVKLDFITVGAAVADTDLTEADNGRAINELLTSLRTAGIIAT